MSVYRGYSLIPDNNVEQNVFSTSNQEYFVILKTFKILLTSVKPNALEAEGRLHVRGIAILFLEMVSFRGEGRGGYRQERM